MFLNSGLCLLSDNRRNGPLGLSWPQRGQGEGKMLKDNLPFATCASLSRGGEALQLACSVRSGTVLSRKVVGETAHSPLQSDSPVRPQRIRGYAKRQKQAGEESWLK